MRSDAALLSISTSLSAITATLTRELSKIFGSPGIGEASEGFSYALQIVVLRAVVFSVVVYAIIKGLERVLAIAFTLMLASFVYLLLLPLLSLVIPVKAAAVLALFVSLLAFTRFRRVFQAILAILTGLYLALFYPLYLIWFLAILLSIADVIATLKGPMRLIAAFLSVPSKPSEILAMRISEDLSIGLGDLLIYASLPSSIAANIGLLEAALATFMVPFGVYLSLKRAERRGIVPALPIPVALMSFVIVVSIIRKAFLEADSEDR